MWQGECHIQAEAPPPATTGTDMLSSTLPNANPIAHGESTHTTAANIPTQQRPLRADPDPRPHPPALKLHHPEIHARTNTYMSTQTNFPYTCPHLAKKAERHARTVPTFKARRTDNAHAQASKPLTNKVNCMASANAQLRGCALRQLQSHPQGRTCS
jgi:hypothetical protein